MGDGSDYDEYNHRIHWNHGQGDGYSAGAGWKFNCIMKYSDYNLITKRSKHVLFRN